MDVASMVTALCRLYDDYNAKIENFSGTNPDTGAAMTISEYVDWIAETVANEKCVSDALNTSTPLLLRTSISPISEIDRLFRNNGFPLLCFGMAGDLFYFIRIRLFAAVQLRYFFISRKKFRFGSRSFI